MLSSISFRKVDTVAVHQFQLLRLSVGLVGVGNDMTISIKFISIPLANQIVGLVIDDKFTMKALLVSWGDVLKVLAILVNVLLVVLWLTLILVVVAAFSPVRALSECSAL